MACATPSAPSRDPDALRQELRPATDRSAAGRTPCSPGGGGTIRTQYLEIDDVGAYATLLARPSWLWGAEHGVNEYGVAIGNEKVYTTLDAQSAPARSSAWTRPLGLERATNADEALEVITGLLARHGQGA